MIIGILVIAFKKREKIDKAISKARQKRVLIPANVKYNVFTIDRSLRDRLETVLDKELDSLNQEYFTLGDIVREVIDESFHVARENAERNRYKDIYPYDSNIINLQEAVGMLITLSQ